MGQDETLSGYKYIHYEFDLEESTREERKAYDFVRINWDVFKQRLQEKRSDLSSVQEDPDRRAEMLQQVSKAACLKYIKSKTTVEGREHDWWTDRLQGMKEIVGKLRRWWQCTRVVEDLEVYKEQRNAYKKKQIIKTEEEYIKNKVEIVINEEPWHRTWGIIANKKDNEVSRKLEDR